MHHAPHEKQKIHSIIAYIFPRSLDREERGGREGRERWREEGREDKDI
jgi:hypothetical protein